MRISDWSSDVCSSDLTCPNMNSPKQKCQGESRGRAASGAAVHLERLDEGRLRNLDLAELAHPLLAFLLLLQQLALSRSEERRVGKEWFSTCTSRWSTYH